MKVIDVVGAVIINDHDEVLCALRSQQMSLPGLWEFPGGKIETGEEQRAALIREIKEELLCDIEVGDRIADVIYEYPTIIVRLITYFAKVTDGMPVATEHERLEWVKKEDLNSLEWAPADIPTVEMLLNSQRSE